MSAGRLGWSHHTLTSSCHRQLASARSLNPPTATTTTAGLAAFRFACLWHEADPAFRSRPVTPATASSTCASYHAHPVCTGTRPIESRGKLDMKSAWDLVCYSHL